MVNVGGQSRWSISMVKVYGECRWSKSMVDVDCQSVWNIDGQCRWSKSMVNVNGQRRWSNPMVNVNVDGPKTAQVLNTMPVEAVVDAYGQSLSVYRSRSSDENSPKSWISKV